MSATWLIEKLYSYTPGERWFTMGLGQSRNLVRDRLTATLAPRTTPAPPPNQVNLATCTPPWELDKNGTGCVCVKPNTLSNGRCLPPPSRQAPSRPSRIPRLLTAIISPSAASCPACDAAPAPDCPVAAPMVCPTCPTCDCWNPPVAPEAQKWILAAAIGASIATVVALADYFGSKK